MSVVRRKYARSAGPISRGSHRAYPLIRPSTLRPPEPEAGDLLGDESEQEQDNPAKEEHHGRGRQVQPVPALRHGPAVSRQRERLQQQEDREEDPEGAEERRDPQDDQ